MQLSREFRQPDSLAVMWADGLTGLLHHIENRAAFVVISPDRPDVQKEFASSRN